MEIEFLSIALILAIVFIALLIIKFIEKKLNINPELKRKMFHMSMGISMLALPYLFKSWESVGILGIIALIVMYILKNTKLKKSLGTVLYSVDRESLGEIFFVISVFVIYCLSNGNKILYSIPILVLTFADSTAAIIGKSYGKKNLAQLNEDAKSIEGSFMFFIVAFMITLVPLLLFTEVGREETLIISTIVGFNVALIEMVSHNGNDNLLIPLTTFAFVSIHITQSVEILRVYLAILAGIYLIITIANRVKALSKLALVETFVVGYLTIILYGIYAIIPPLMTLLTVMRFPRKIDSEKNNIYDARIIETNIILPIAICVIAAVTGWKEEFFMIYVTTYAMHLIVNTFVRLKYYFKFSPLDCMLLSISKGIGFVFIPGLIIQQLVFPNFTSIYMLISMIVAMVLSAILIYQKKINVKEETISVDNGYMHMNIVLICVSLVVMSQLIYQNILV